MTNRPHSIQMADAVRTQGHLMSAALTLADTGFFDSTEKISDTIVMLWPDHSRDWRDLTRDPHVAAVLEQRRERALRQRLKSHGSLS